MEGQQESEGYRRDERKQGGKCGWSRQRGKCLSRPVPLPAGPGCRWRLLYHVPEKAMAAPSSALAWRIPGTEEPGGLLSTGLHRVRHD